mmetsp:Transcript_5675/g.10254  ORF Transcript_5675/g.10254 Transcript_5675/m.10254 type:complete len:261 (-) Transcript_5675:191-973(-)
MLQIFFVIYIMENQENQIFQQEAGPSRPQRPPRPRKPAISEGIRAFTSSTTPSIAALISAMVGIPSVKSSRTPSTLSSPVASRRHTLKSPPPSQHSPIEAHKVSSNPADWQALSNVPQSPSPSISSSWSKSPNASPAPSAPLAAASAVAACAQSVIAPPPLQHSTTWAHSASSTAILQACSNITQLSSRSVPIDSNNSPNAVEFSSTNDSRVISASSGTSSFRNGIVSSMDSMEKPFIMASRRHALNSSKSAFSGQHALI